MAGRRREREVLPVCTYSFLYSQPPTTYCLQQQWRDNTRRLPPPEVLSCAQTVGKRCNPGRWTGIQPCLLRLWRADSTQRRAMGAVSIGAIGMSMRGVSPTKDLLRQLGAQQDVASRREKARRGQQSRPVRATGRTARSIATVAEGANQQKLIWPHTTVRIVPVRFVLCCYCMYALL